MVVLGPVEWRAYEQAAQLGSCVDDPRRAGISAAITYKNPQQNIPLSFCLVSGYLLFNAGYERHTCFEGLFCICPGCVELKTSNNLESCTSVYRCLNTTAGSEMTNILMFNLKLRDHARDLTGDKNL